MARPPLTAERFAEDAGVSRETCERLGAYLALLRRWQPAINLVGTSTLADPWRRHIADSAQLLPLLPAATRTVVDLGSGAGLPGLVLAILGVPEVHAIESDRRKAQFLREAARATDAKLRVHACRIEEVADPIRADVVTARALAPIGRLLGLATRFVGDGTTQLYLKGGHVEDERAEAEAEWAFSCSVHPSRTDASGAIVRITDVRRRA
ncbi:16S rRNA (guanine(527)-N(7))-methyltransferase RsmG [Marinivivus vitaminiproducens]|uniref:16S rRNA (guanine(527)-N(7))-methyltransferase RsmG n=1 Tax=Marinivivus vitaminiproducens TaxID=3035935 RepID=UPI00279BE216|nr:16S rRNA (guanine(527)-N(7))-methyltransferase RsmG [Geminicoccaceae bacterium SCSIO 64248]